MTDGVCVQRIAIQGALDFELQVPRDNPLEFELAYRPGEDHAGIFFYIAGFNDPVGYSEGLLRSIVRDYGYAAVAVKYHCYRARVEQGADLVLTTKSRLLLDGLIEEYLSENNRLRELSLTDLLEFLGKKAPTKIDLYAVLQPPGDEYQNFGLMQALDHIYVAEYLRREGLRANFGRIILLGTSYGGYIAMMLAKIAPGFASMIIDNSSYVIPPKEWMWDAEIEENQVGGEVIWGFDNIRLNANCVTLWRHGGPPEDPFHYGPEHQAIRNLASAEHFDMAKTYMEHAMQIYSWNAGTGDVISPANNKILQQQVLDGGPISMNLTLVRPEDIDGRIFKSMEHGMGASLKGLFALAHERADSLPDRSDYQRIDRISYECGPKRYLFERTNNPHFPMILTLHDA